MAVGRTAKGRIKKGYKLSKGGRVVKVGGRRRKRKANPSPAPKRRRRRRRTVSNPPKRRRRTVARRRVRRRRAPARRRRRTYRRNPVKLRGLTKTVGDAAIGAFQVLGGKALARVIPDQLGIPVAGTTGIAAQAGIALLVGVFGKQLFGAKAGQMLLIGAMTAPVESIVVAANVPILSPALSAYPMPMLGAYVEPAGLLPAGDVTMGEYEYGQQYGY